MSLRRFIVVAIAASFCSLILAAVDDVSSIFADFLQFSMICSPMALCKIDSDFAPRTGLRAAMGAVMPLSASMMVVDVVELLMKNDSCFSLVASIIFVASVALFLVHFYRFVLERGLEK